MTPVHSFHSDECWSVEKKLRFSVPFFFQWKTKRVTSFTCSSIRRLGRYFHCFLHRLVCGIDKFLCCFYPISPPPPKATLHKLANFHSKKQKKNISHSNDTFPSEKFPENCIRPLCVWLINHFTGSRRLISIKISWIKRFHPKKTKKWAALRRKKGVASWVDQELRCEGCCCDRWPIGGQMEAAGVWPVIMWLSLSAPEWP